MAGGALTIATLDSLNLNNKTIIGNLNFTTAAPGTISLGAGTLNGNLTINTPAASFINNATVTGTTTITDVAPGTFSNTGTLTGLVTVTDTDARIVNTGTLTAGIDINQTTQGVIKLEGTFNKVIVSKATRINLTGTITTLTANEPVVVEGGTIINSTGTVVISFTSADVFNTETPFLSGYFTAGGVQVPSTGQQIEDALKARLVELKAIEPGSPDATGRDLEAIAAYKAEDIKFNFDNIKFSADGKTVTITGPLFSKTAFEVAKGALVANYASPFNISLFKEGANPTQSGAINNADKLARIQIDKFGNATVVKF